MNLSGFGIKAGYDAVEISPDQITHHDRRGEIVALARMGPRDRSIGGADLRRADVAGCVEAHRAHWAEAAMRAGQDSEVARGDRRGNGDIAALFQAPELVPGGQIVAADLFPT